MNALDLMKVIGEMPEEVIASCCFMKPNQITQRNTLVQPQLNETGKEDLPLQKESFVNSKMRRKDTIKHKTTKNTAGRLLPWHIVIGITAAACAIFAVSVGIDVIERNSQMQVGTSMSTTTSKQNSERGPIEIASAEQTYAELELHENEKRVCTMEQVDAIMESGYAEFKQNGRKTIDKDRYIALIHNGNRQADDLEIKSFIYHMMLNSIDYFNRAEGSMTYAIPKESPVEIDFQTDIALQECYESESESGEEIGKLYVSDGNTHRIDLENKRCKNTSLATPAEFVVNDNSRTMLLDNGEAMTLNRNDLTNLGIAGNSCLFPQLYAVNYLSDFDNWHFSEAKDYLERDCVKIEGKHQEKHFEMLVDVNTGIMLNYEVYNQSNELLSYVKTTALQIDIPLKIQHFDDTLYADFDSE